MSTRFAADKSRSSYYDLIRFDRPIPSVRTKWIFQKKSLIAFFLVIGSSCMAAKGQTTVTADGSGTINNIPKYSGAASLTSSALTEVNGQVGIRTASPQALLDIHGNLGSNFINLYDTYGDPDFNSITNIVFSGPDAPNGFSQIIGGGDPCCYSNGAGFLAFDTANGGQSLVEHMRIAASGGVGIGTPSPQNLLSINGGEDIDQDDDNVGSVYPYGLTFGYSSGEGIGSARSGGSAVNQYGLDFFTSFISRMSITAAGNVGIGTATPNSALEVNGSIKLDGAGSIVFPDGTSLSSATSLNQSGLPPGTASVITQSSGNIGIGTTTPQSTLQIAGPSVALATNGTPFGNGNTIIQGVGPRSVTAGSALSFAMAANLDGSNVWEQARIIATGDNANNADARGRLYFQTRFINSSNTWDWNNNLVLTSNGSVGINTTSPSQDLQVLNSSNNLVPYVATGPVLEVNGTIALTTGSKGSMIFPDGTVQSTAWNGTTFGDYAESVDVLGERESYEPGDVIVIDERVDGKFQKSCEPYSNLVAGVYSTKPGLVGRRVESERPDQPAEVPMAMMGIVPTKVSAENGAIRRGDLLVSSSTPGYAMKGTDRGRLTGAVIGKALAPLVSGSGVIEVLISLQ